MKINALSVANYFIKLANDNGVPIYPLGLMKRVYIAHGFSLALADKSLLDPRFDEVQAWKYGPVIPSVYHSFKHLRNNRITMADRAIIMNFDFDFNTDQDGFVFCTPELEDNDAKKVVEMVWNRYKTVSDREMVNLTHREGTPWEHLYKPNQNVAIPDWYTKLYYEELVKQAMKKENE